MADKKKKARKKHAPNKAKKAARKPAKKKAKTPVQPKASKGKRSLKNLIGVPRILSRKKTPKEEVKVFRAEVTKGKKLGLRKKGKKSYTRPKQFEILKVGVSKFDDLIGDKGLERNSTILISGGCGTGKTTFALQSLYFGALNGQKSIFISFEEEPEKIKAHMMKNFGWDFQALEKKKLVKFIKLDPIKTARKVEASRFRESGTLRIKVAPLKLPFTPDRLVVDSLSALSIAFEAEENYRRYIRHLFETLESYNSINFVLTETEQDPKIYSRAGIEEFLADGVVVLYNIKIKGRRRMALEILKLRSSSHAKRLIPYRLTSKGVDILPERKDDIFPSF
jgi:KaiC/GvpD/RAD55 family RecA-like ATPase